MTDLSPWYEARDELTARLRRGLIGDAELDAEIRERPMDRFVMGVLYPQFRTDPPPPEDPLVDDSASGDDGGDESGDDAPVAAAKTMRPSSMGFTFYSVPGATLNIAFRAGRYAPSETDQGEPVWRRSAVDVDRSWTAREGLEELYRDDAGLVLAVVARRVGDRLACTVSAVLDVAADRGHQDVQCLFQCDLEADSAAGFQAAPAPAAIQDLEEAATSMLYRDRRSYAVGHACSVDWSGEPLVTQIRSTFMPIYDLPLADASRSDVPSLVMATLTDTLDANELCSALIGAYRTWILARRDDGTRLPAHHQAAAFANLDEASSAADRMQQGLDLLNADERVREAFQLMNESMRRQRLRDQQVGGEPAWRPFQLAFILMNLNGLTSPEHPDRELADLLWFPTGGGKTEAYLGLISYSLWLRRLRNPNDAGLSVLMRYTLRLLTLDQFERASVLICAMELIREERLPEAAEFSIGLWVGQATTPNKLSGAKQALSRLDRGRSLPTDESDPTQLKRCPWCGGDLLAKHYVVVGDRLRITCGNSACAFSGPRSLPVILVDEEVYERRPSMLIATVDKFAMMAWKADVRKLFSRDGANSAVDLIIQDELHLISGPLGTLTGLYETVVDMLATGIARAKIVASTATIRRSAEQVRAVFDREPAQFPPSGLDPSDNFFAVDAAPSDKGDRRYLGVMAGGISHSTLMIRVVAILLQGAAELDATDEVRDAYWTLIGYFNSLRVLGSAVVQYYDDVPDVIKYLAGEGESDRRRVTEIQELTSRKGAQEIRDTKAALAYPIGDEGALDIVAATNMISVGLDVDRLGLMTVMGQPQTTAEYIQATSRVGRSRPGLVVDILNAARNRDRSHYEGFKAFHQSLYRQVEPVTVTPFAARSRDRGLHGALVSAVRALVPTLNISPQHIEGSTPELETLIDDFVARCSRIAPDAADDMRQELERLVDAWGQANVVSVYEGWYPKQRDLLRYLLVQARSSSEFPVGTNPWPTLTSLRNVDAETRLTASADRIKENR